MQYMYYMQKQTIDCFERTLYCMYCRFHFLALGKSGRKKKFLNAKNSLWSKNSLWFLHVLHILSIKAWGRGRIYRKVVSRQEDLSNSLAALGEAIDVESEVYCRRRSGNFWRMRAALGLACAQAATLGTQVVGRPRSRPRYAARPRH